MTTTFDTDSTTHTIAAAAISDPTESLHAWASSPLGELDDDISDSFEAIEERKPSANRAALAATLAAGIIGGATLGAVLFGYADPAQPTFVVPWGAVKTSPSQAVQSPPSSPQPKPAGATAVAPKPAGQAPAPKPIVSEPKTNQDVVPAPVDPGTPPVIAPPVIVDVLIPPLPPLDGGNPLPPALPEPPTFDPPNIEAVPVPEADPEPPNNKVFEAAPIDPSLQKPTVNGLKPVETGSRWTVNLNDQAKKPPTQRQVAPTPSRFNAISKP